VPDYEATRAAAHVFVDVLSAHDAENDEASALAMETAFERINQVGALTVTTGAKGVVEIDATPLMGAVIIPMRYLLRQVELHTGLGWDEVIVAFRQWIDETMTDDED
jgi:hypothetical protein